MVRRIILSLVVCSTIAISDRALSQSDSTLWSDFSRALRSGTMTAERIRPYDQLGDSFKPILLGYLDSLRVNATPEDWNVRPEILRTGNRTHFIVPWTERGRKVTYCLSFLTENKTWYFQHIESIIMRLDTVKTVPTSVFPDIPEAQKSWIRVETHWSYLIQNFYLPIARQWGKEAALNMFKDGAGYFLAAKAWIPFSSPARAFVLYLCWDQADLWGNGVTLVKLDEREAIVRVKSQYFELYTAAGHLKPIISFEDYRGIFETIWTDRATNAGWRVRFEYGPEHVVTFNLEK